MKIEEHPFTAILVLIGLLVSTPTGVIGLWSRFKDAMVDYLPSKPSIVLNEIDYMNSQSIYADKPLIIQQNGTVISVDEKEYIMDGWFGMSNYYIQSALITNRNSSNDVVLTKFNLCAENIEIDYTPVLDAYADCYGNNEIQINLYNMGWSDISCIDIALKDEKGVLNFSKYSKCIDKLEYGTRDTVSIQLNMSDFEYLTDYGDCEYPLNLEVRYRESDDAFTYKTRCIIRVEGSEVFVPDTGYGKGASKNAYGICVDTNKYSFKFSQSIQELITADETLELPIFFFPDRSCEFDYYLEFEVSNDGTRQKIKTDLKHVKYIVNSFTDANRFDASKLEELKGWKEEVECVSYPYSIEWEWCDDLS